MSTPPENQTQRGRGVYLDQATPAAAPPRQGVKGRGLLVEIAEVALLAFVLYLVINFAIQTVHVIGSSMYPTVMDQDYLIATKIDYRLHPPQRGDIIIMRDPYDPSRDFIKRIVGVPGDHILIRGGQVYINGHALKEPYINPQEPWTEDADWPLTPTTDPEGVLLGSDEYFVMGDNRNHSSDSRVFGVVHRDQIEAKAWMRVLPLNKIGPVETSQATITSQGMPSTPAQPAA